MRNLNFQLTAAFLLMFLTSFGQIQKEIPDERPYIEVNGTAEKEVVPDEIYIGITIREKYENRVKVTIEEQELKLKDAIKNLGIDLKNLSLADANADYVKVRWQKKDVLTQKDYTLKVGDAVTVGMVFLELDKIDIKEAYISKVNHSKLDSLKKEVKIAAINDAKAKADYLLAAIGEQTGKPLIITETDKFVSPDSRIFGGNTKDRQIYYDYVDGMSMQSKFENEIQFQKIKIRTDMYAKFAIK